MHMAMKVIFTELGWNLVVWMVRALTAQDD